MGAIPPSSRGAVAEVQADLTTAQIATLNSVPITLLAAQGAGTVIVPIAGTLQYKPGTVPFGNTASVQVLVGVAGGVTLGNPSLDDVVATITEGSVAAGQLIANTALTLAANGDPGLTGAILTTTLVNGGSGYAANDTGTIGTGNGAPLVAATYKVLAVGGGGAVLTYQITNAGNGYPVRVGVPTTVVTGGGDGNFTMTINSITPHSDGTGRVTVLYYVMALR